MSSGYEDFVREEKLLVMMPTELLMFNQEHQMDIVHGFMECIEELFAEKINEQMWEGIYEKNNSIFQKIPQKLIENSLPEEQIIDLVRKEVVKLRKTYHVSHVVICLCGMQPEKLEPFEKELVNMGRHWMKDKLTRIRDELKKDSGLDEAFLVYYNFRSFQELLSHLTNKEHIIKIKDSVIVS